MLGNRQNQSSARLEGRVHLRKHHLVLRYMLQYIEHPHEIEFLPVRDPAGVHLEKLGSFETSAGLFQSIGVDLAPAKFQRGQRPFQSGKDKGVATTDLQELSFRTEPFPQRPKDYFVSGTEPKMLLLECRQPFEI